MSICNIEILISREFSDKVCQKVKEWEQKENGLSFKTSICISLILLIGTTLSYLMMSRTIDNHVFDGCATVFIIFSTFTCFVPLNRLSQKYDFYCEERKFKRRYRKLGKILKKLLLVKKSAQMPLHLQKVLFKEMTKYLSSEEKMRLSQVNRSCHSELTSSFEKKFIHHTQFLWQDLELIRKKEKEINLRNQTNLQFHLDSDDRDHSLIFGIPYYESLSSREYFIKSIHSQFFQYHSELLPQLMVQISKMKAV